MHCNDPAAICAAVQTRGRWRVRRCQAHAHAVAAVAAPRRRTWSRKSSGLPVTRHVSCSPVGRCSGSSQAGRPPSLLGNRWRSRSVRFRGCSTNPSSHSQRSIDSASESDSCSRAAMMAGGGLSLGPGARVLGDKCGPADPRNSAHMAGSMRQNGKSAPATWRAAQRCAQLSLPNESYNPTMCMHAKNTTHAMQCK